MSKMLILARGDGRQFFDLSGKSILADLPFETLVFVDKHNLHHFKDLSGVLLEVVRWSDLPDIILRAERAHANHGLFAIATLDEKKIDFAAELRARLGVSGFDPTTVARFRNKVEMKRRLAPAGLRVPQFVECSDRAAVYQLLERSGKIVVKPSNGCGSRDVSIIDSAAALDALFAEEADIAHYEAEEFIDGVLYHINAIVHEGSVKLTASAPYLPGMANIDFASGTPFVSVMLPTGDLRERLEDFSTRVIQALALRNGVTHLECFVTDAGEIVFCEIAIRPGGGGIVLMMETQYGVNYARATLLLEAGRGDLVFGEKKAQDGMAALIGFRSGSGGIVKQAAGLDAFREDWIHHAYVDVKPGEFIAPSAHCTDYMGLVIFSSRDQGDFDTKRTALYQRFYASLAVEPL